jgi:hypothetical protein
MAYGYQYIAESHEGAVRDARTMRIRVEAADVVSMVADMFPGEEEFGIEEFFDYMNAVEVDEEYIEALSEEVGKLL